VGVILSEAKDLRDPSALRPQGDKKERPQGDKKERPQGDRKRKASG